MKVLITLGGITHYFSAFMDKIVDKGIDMATIIPKQTDKQFCKEGVKVVEEKGKYKVFYSTLKKKWYGKTALVDLKEVLEEFRPDILIFQWPYFLQYVFDRSLRRLMTKHHIRLIIREIPFNTPPYGRLSYFKKHPVYDENLILKSKGLKFIFNSLLVMAIRKFLYTRASASINYASSAYDIIPSYGISKEAVFVTNNTIDTDTLFKAKEKVLSTPALLSSGKRRILHIGRLVRWKRVDLLIAAFALLAPYYPDIELVIVGNGPESDNLKSQVKKLDIESKVVFTGAVYDPYILGKYMHESMMYVLSGMGGLSINEAMCYSLPVICSVCDGTERDLVFDGENGLYFIEGDINSLKEKIEYLLKDPQRACEFGAKSIEIIRNKINSETVSERFVKALEYAFLH